MTKEQELLQQLEEEKKGVMEKKLPLLCKYLLDNGFTFFEFNEAYKPLTDELEVGVRIYPSYNTASITFYDRTKTCIKFNKIQRYPIGDVGNFMLSFDQVERFMISRLENLVLPKKYDITWTKKEAIYLIGGLDAAEDYADQVRQEGHDSFTITEVN